MPQITPETESARIDASQLKVGTIINTSSGGCDPESETEMLEILKLSGVTNCKTWCGEADQIERAFAESAKHKPDVLIVLGGDGTIRSAAEACAGTHSYLLPLPGGTMNMLPRALYGDVSWQETLKDTLASPTTKTLSGGRATNKLFFVAALVGVPALWIEAREAMREYDVGEAFKKSTVALQKMFDTKLQYLISPQLSGKAEVVAIICPFVSEQMSGSEQALEAAAIDLDGAAELLGFATAAAFGSWRENKTVTLSKTKRVIVQSTRDIPLYLDGERVKADKMTEIIFVPNAVNVIVPANRITSPTSSQRSPGAASE
jgi:diacylglycerol kinase family enzyme